MPAWFAPTSFAHVRIKDTQRFKQFRKAIVQLDEEGVVQVLRDVDTGDQNPMFAAVGPMQFDVALWRLENEFNAPATLNHTNFSVARLTDEASTPTLRSMRGVTVMQRSDGAFLALFESPCWLERLQADHPELRLERLLAEG